MTTATPNWIWEWSARKSANSRRPFPRAQSRLEISRRNSRIAALQERWDRLRAGRDLILDQRGAEMVDFARRRHRIAGARLQGQESRQAGGPHRRREVLLVAELRGHERQAAEELEPWKTRVKECKPLAASPAAIS
jgi:hypothetical protein